MRKWLVRPSIIGTQLVAKKGHNFRGSNLGPVWSDADLGLKQLGGTPRRRAESRTFQNCSTQVIGGPAPGAPTRAAGPAICRPITKPEHLPL